MSIVFLSKFGIYHTREMVLFHEFFFFFTSFYNQIDVLFSDALFRKPYKKAAYVERTYAAIYCVVL